MFAAAQLMLRNALQNSRSLMRLTNETFELYSRLIDLLSERRYVRVGLGEDLATLPEGATAEADRISVAADGDAVEIASQTYNYPYALLIRDVVLEGEGLTFRVKKKLADASYRYFTPAQLPLVTDNLVLLVTIQPGGHFKKAAVLQEILV